MLTSNNTTEGQGAPRQGEPMPQDYKPAKRRPTHPGRLIKSSLEALDLTPYAAAPLLGITKQALGNLITEKSAISPEMALRLGRFFGNGPQLWSDMQREVDYWDVMQKKGKEIRKVAFRDWEGREEIDG